MLSALWSAKGGAGTTTTAVALADIRRRSHRTTDTLLVDLAGDLPAALGLSDPDLGVTEWLASDAGPEALTRIEREVADGVSLLPLGNTSEWPEARSTRWWACSAPTIATGRRRRPPRAVAAAPGVAAPSA